MLRWVHTCNVTAYCNVVTLQVTDMIRSYEVNFHPVPHGITVSCERYNTGFPVCYGSPSDVFAASIGFVHLYALRFKEKERRWWQRQLYTSREVYSGSSLLADLNFQSVGGLYKNFTRTSRSEFEFLINLIGEKKSQKKGHSIQESHFCSRKVGTDARIDGSVHFFPQFFPCILLSNFVKMHWVFWVPNYFVSFKMFDKF